MSYTMQKGRGSVLRGMSGEYVQGKMSESRPV